MPPAFRVRYVDSDVFLGWLQREPDNVDECRTVIRGAEEGKVRLVTPSSTLVEVIEAGTGA